MNMWISIYFPKDIFNIDKWLKLVQYLQDVKNG